MSEAVDHALLAGDEQRAVEIVEQDGMTLLEYGQMASLIGLVGKLPAATIETHPRLRLDLAWANILLHRADPAERALRLAEEHLDRGGLDETRTANLRAEAGVVHAVVTVRADVLGGVEDMLAPCFRRADQLPPYVVAIAANVATFAAGYRCDFEEAVRIQEWSAPYMRRNKGSYNNIHGRCFLGLAAGLRLDIGRAEQHFRAALKAAKQTGGTHSYGARLAGSLLGELLYERDQLAEGYKLRGGGADQGAARRPRRRDPAAQRGGPRRALDGVAAPGRRGGERTAPPRAAAASGVRPIAGGGLRAPSDAGRRAPLAGRARRVPHRPGRSRSGTDDLSARSATAAACLCACAAISGEVRHGGAVQSIVLEQIGVSRGGRTIFADIDLTISSGGCTAVVGPSGVGKTTLLRLFNRLAEPSSGRILLDGVPVAELDVLALRRRIGLVAQHPVLLTEVVADEVRVGRPALWDEQAGALLRRVGLPETFVHRRCEELSGGEAQRVCLARALAVAPEVLLLDEPTSALDEAAAAVIGDVVRAHCRTGGSAVLVSHDSDFTGAVADDILLLEDGRLAPLGGGPSPGGQAPWWRDGPASLTRYGSTNG
ncbi:ATP-binding cassette domain-containing protein [Nocardia thraciensis]